MVGCTIRMHHTNMYLVLTALICKFKITITTFLSEIIKSQNKCQLALISFFKIPVQHARNRALLLSKLDKCIKLLDLSFLSVIIKLFPLILIIWNRQIKSTETDLSWLFVCCHIAKVAWKNVILQFSYLKIFSPLWSQSLSWYHPENSEERAGSSSWRREEHRQILLPEMCGPQLGTGECSWLFIVVFYSWVVFHRADCKEKQCRQFD